MYFSVYIPCIFVVPNFRQTYKNRGRNLELFVEVVRRKRKTESCGWHESTVYSRLCDVLVTFDRNVYRKFSSRPRLVREFEWTKFRGRIRQRKWTMRASTTNSAAHCRIIRWLRKNSRLFARLRNRKIYTVVTLNSSWLQTSEIKNIRTSFPR